MEVRSHPSLMKFGMKNPYEVKKLSFSPEHLHSKSQEIRAIKNKSDLYALRIRYLVGDLEVLWQNEIQSSLIAELGSIQNTLADHSALLEEYAALLDFAAEEVRSHPGSVIKQPGEAQDEPVTVILSHVPDFKQLRNDTLAANAFGIPGMIGTEQDTGLTYTVFRLLSKAGILKRGEAPKTQLLLQTLKNEALDMRSAITQYNYNIQKMQYVIEEMEKLWQNDAQSVLIEELGQTESSVKDFSDIVDEFAALLDMAVQELESGHTDIDQVSVLSGGKDGPVSIALSGIPYLKNARINLRAYDPYFERTQTDVSTVVLASRKNSEYLYNVYEDHIELVKYIGLKRTVEVPELLDGLPVTHIGLDCFAMAWRVRFVRVTLPESVTTIYHGAFRGCSTIRELKLPKSLRYIGNYAFAFITDLEHVDIPEGVESLGMGAFRNCAGLKEIVIPDATRRVGNDCFYTCKNLKSVVIGDGVVEIDDWAFRQCEHLESVTLGDNVAAIGESAFYDDVLLTRLDIPDKVREIGAHAFYHRRGMTLGVTAGSAAERYAGEYRLQYILV